MIFISFAGEDADLARALGLRMRAAGADVWCSVFKDDLDDGHPWSDQIYAALDRCDVFVLLVTGAPIDGMTKEESDYARDLYNKRKRPRVVSVRLDESVALPKRYESLQSVVLPANWQSETSDFVEMKMHQWGEVAAHADPSTSIPPEVSADAEPATTPGSASAPRDELPASPTRTATSASVAPPESAPGSVSRSAPHRRGSTRGSQVDLLLRVGLAVVALLPLAVWGFFRLYDSAGSRRDPTSESSRYLFVRVAQLAEECELLFTKLEDAAATPLVEDDLYDAHAAAYQGLIAATRSLERRATQIEGKLIPRKQLELLRDSLEKMQSEHRARSSGSEPTGFPPAAMVFAARGDGYPVPKLRGASARAQRSIAFDARQEHVPRPRSASLTASVSEL